MCKQNSYEGYGGENIAQSVVRVIELNAVEPADLLKPVVACQRLEDAERVQRACDSGRVVVDPDSREGMLEHCEVEARVVERNFFGIRTNQREGEPELVLKLVRGLELRARDVDSDRSGRPASKPRRLRLPWSTLNHKWLL